MMTLRIYITGLILVLAAHCSASVPAGFPWSNQSNMTTWAELHSTYAPLLAWYSGTVWRCEMANIAAPEWTDTWTVPAGSYETVYTNGDVVWTNTTLVTASYKTTNCLTPFEYTVTNAYGTHSGTGFPLVTENMWVSLENKFDELLTAGFVSTSEVARFNDYCDINPYITVTPFPLESKAGLFYRNGIGVVDTNSLTTNALGFVTGGSANWTRFEEHGVSLLGEASVQDSYSLVNFTDELDGEYTWVGKAYSAGLWLGGSAWYKIDGSPYNWTSIYWGSENTAYSGSYMTWIVRDGFFKEYALVPGKALPIGTNGEWRTHFYEEPVSNAYSIAVKGWVYHRLEDPVFNIVDYFYLGGVAGVGNNIRPCVHYQRSDGITNWNALTVDVVGNTAEGFPANYTVTTWPTVTERVDVVSEWTSLTNVFHRVTDIQISGSGDYGDSVAVLYTNLVLGAARTGRVLTRMLDERVAALIPLRWRAYTDNLTDPSFMQTNNYVGSSSSVTSSWGAAKAEVESDWGVNTVDLYYPPHEWTRGRHYTSAGEKWSAEAGGSRARFVATNVCSSFAGTLEFWGELRSNIRTIAPPASNNWEMGEVPFTNTLDTARLFYSTALSSTNIIRTPYYGSTNAITASSSKWVDEPPLGSILTYYVKSWAIYGYTHKLIKYEPEW